MPKVNLYATFRDLTGTSQLQVEGQTVGEVLENLIRLYPRMREELFEGEALAERVSVFLEGRDVRYLNGLATPLAEEATLDLFPPVAGGTFAQRFGALPAWLLERYLSEWGGRKLEEGVYALPGARVHFAEAEPLRVGSLVVPQLLVQVEGEKAQAWWARILLAASRGGG
ncbi:MULTISPECIES: ubiquitin-like small modifier protein 1 [Thermus]|uniref:ubiquitin-like small modifier protein 1 n=1 Tax=Thermus TaxID=270 RepID=UPI00056DAAF4|nr:MULTISPECIES: ubiquitin-like small modifier protein 1 [Thermus]